MKRYFSGLCAALLLCAASLCMGQEAVYSDGIYRGSYYEGGIEQIAIQFELKDGVFTSIVYRAVKYKDGDYMIEDASDPQKAALRQYRQLADYLIGKGVEAIDMLYTPYNIVDDVDAVTSATMQSSKLISALWDGINRRPYKLVDTSSLPQVGDYADGVYRGSYMEDGGEQVALEFRIRGNCFADVKFRALEYQGVDYLGEGLSKEESALAAQYGDLIGYLVGKPVSAVNELYLPGEIVPDTDVCSGATIRAPKVISAIWDGLNRRVYRID